jgi:carbonic anhydrase
MIFIGSRRGFARSGVAAVVFLIAFLALAAYADVHWSYSGETGPENWANLSPEFKDAAGGEQSPIDITDERLKNGVEFFYRDAACSVLNNGHTIQVTPETGESGILVDGVRFSLRQFHFHTPSEHTLNGKHAAMEIHFVHGDDSGRLAVAALFVDEGDGNGVIAEVLAAAPTERGKSASAGRSFPLTSLLPGNLDGVRYEGSLTTPPTVEGVFWIILSEHGAASAKQIRRFTEMFGENARPTQPLNGRTLAPFKGVSGR